MRVRMAISWREQVQNEMITCNKLKVMGVRSTKWFQPYLTDRKQKVSANDTESEFLNVTCGVPPG